MRSINSFREVKSDSLIFLQTQIITLLIHIENTISQEIIYKLERLQKH